MTTTYTPIESTWHEAQVNARALMPVRDPIRLLAGTVCAMDLAVVAFSSAIAFLLRHGPSQPPDQIMSMTVFAMALTLTVFWLGGCYTRHRADPTVRQIGQAARGWMMVVSFLLLWAYLSKTSDEFSRFWAVAWFLGALAGFAAVRLVVRAQVESWRRRGKLTRTVAVVDLSGNGDELARRLHRTSAGDVRLVGVFSPERVGSRRNSVADLIVLARLFRIDEILIAISGRGDPGLEAVVTSLGTIPATVRLCPDMPSVPWPLRQVDMLFDEPVFTVMQRPLLGWNCVVKRAEDLVLSSILTVFLAPVMAMIAIIIKLDSPGPVLFRQDRSGFNNNTISIFKFRTMFHEAAPDGDVRQAQRNDPRVTRVGAVLRKLSLDELPQLFNVLRGEMSLVGPRPHAIAHNDQYAALIGDYLSRHRVQPGITGWAQVNGFRGETDVLEKMQRRVEYDLAYIDRWSLRLDLRILVQTGFRTIMDRNAY